MKLPLTSILKDVYVLWSGSQVSHGLHELHPWLLILLKHCTARNRQKHKFDFQLNVPLMTRAAHGAHLEWSAVESLLPFRCIFTLERTTGASGASLPVVSRFLGGVVVTRRRGNRQEARRSAAGSPEDRLLQRDARLSETAPPSQRRLRFPENVSRVRALPTASLVSVRAVFCFPAKNTTAHSDQGGFKEKKTKKKKQKRQFTAAVGW